MRPTPAAANIPAFQTPHSNHSHLSATTANLTFKGFGASGEAYPAFGAASFSLPAGTQFSMLGSEFLHSLQAGWVQLRSDTADIMEKSSSRL